MKQKEIYAMYIISIISIAGNISILLIILILHYQETYVRDTLPDSGREKGRSSTGKSDTHSNTQFHKNYLDKKMQLELEKEKEIQRLKRVEEGIEDSDENENEDESGMRGPGSDNDSEVGSDVQFSVSISSIYDQPQGLILHTLLLLLL